MKPGVPALLSLAVLAACGGAPPPASSVGGVRFSFHAQPARTLSLVLPSICADFSLAPYSIDAGGAHQPAGGIVHVSQSAPGQTAFVAGCVDGAPAVPGDDWGYLVTASNWHLCDPNAPLDASLAAYLQSHQLTLAQLLASFSPQVATTSVDLDCKAGLDVAAPVTVAVSVPLEGRTGYVDIAVQVDVTEVEVGCKQGDVDAQGWLHFGESATLAEGGKIPLGFLGLAAAQGGHLSPVDPGSLQQYAGAVTFAAQTTGYYTGMLQLPEPAASQTTQLELVQGFAGACPPGQAWVQTQAVACNTTVQLGGAAPAVATRPGLADVFEVLAGTGWVEATLRAGLGVELRAGFGGAALSSWDPATSTATVHANALQLSSLLFAGQAVLGVYPRTGRFGRLLVVTAGTGGVVVHQVQVGPAGWSDAGALPTATLSTSELHALGLYTSTAGCQPQTGG